MKRLLLILFCTVVVASAQDDPLADHFIPPEVIMKHQGELGISSAQREEIKQQVRNAQVKFTELQWDIQAEIEGLTKLLEDRNAGEGPVIEQLDRVLAVEAAIKRTQVSMLMALRRVLTDEQLEQARDLSYGGFAMRGITAEIQRGAQRMAREARLKAVRAQREQANQELKARKELGEPRPKD
jgi:hypothetical protein